MVVIKCGGIAGEYVLDRLSKLFAEQIERGVLVLPAGYTLEAVYDIPPCEVKLEAADE